MASYDYYGTQPPTRPPHRTDTPDFNAPLPPTPSSGSLKPSRLNTSPPRKYPVESPIYDYNDRPPHNRQESQLTLGGDSAYHGAASRLPDDGQYADNIPLRQQHSKTSADSPQKYEAGTQLPSPVKKKGFAKFLGSGKEYTTWFCYVLFLIQVSVFIAEIAKNAVVTGSPIMIKPQFNPMIGPSTYIQINMGARFVPCMRSTIGVQDSSIPISWPCPRTTTNDPNDSANKCTLSDLCGFGGVPNPVVNGKITDNPQPNQWFRFIVPMFLHAGIIHIAFNMLLQLTLGRDMEKKIGPLRFGLVYFSAGIFGFVLGGNYAASGIASTGASGCLFGILALNLLDLLYTWSYRPSPLKDLGFIMLDIVISFVLGLLPGLDNFSHIGGFLMGLVLGVCLLHSPDKLRERIGEGKPYVDNTLPFEPMRGDEMNRKTGEEKHFVKAPVGFFKGRKLLWWAWWLLRAGALVGVFVSFIVLLNNFYKYRVQCGWCKYLSCLPINNWCEIGNLHLTNTNTTSKRDVLDTMASLF